MILELESVRGSRPSKQLGNPLGGKMKMTEKEIALMFFGIEADENDDLSALTPLVEKAVSE